MDSQSAPSALDQDDQWVFAMIEAISQYAELWNMDDPGYRLVHTLRKTSWEKVADTVKEACGIEKTGKVLSSYSGAPYSVLCIFVSVEVLQHRWGRILNKYRQGKKKPPTGSAGGAKKPSKYAAAMSFLENQSSHRR